MKILRKSFFLEHENDSRNVMPARVWIGETDTGIPVICYITRIAVREDLPEEAHAQFKRELSEERKPTAEIEAIPLRLIL